MTDNRPENVYRSGGSTEATQTFDTDELRAARDAAAQSEADDLAAQRAQEKADRDRTLGKVPRTADPVATGPVVKHHTNDRFAGSLGLFLLRLATAGIIGVHGFQKLTNIAATEAFMGSLHLPSPHWFAWGQGIAEVLAAVALVFGLFTRIAGLGVAAVGIGALVLVNWKHGIPVKSGISGFVGETELMLAAVGLALFFLGAGRWSIDGQWRANRRKAKLEG